MSEISKRLTKFRKIAGLSQEEVADKLNVSRQTVSKWETGQSTPDFDKIAPLCELYNISTDELLRGVVVDKKEEEKEEPKDADKDEDDDDDDDDDECEECGKKSYHKRTATSAIVKSIFSILSLVTLVFYLAVSFATHAWHKTWIIWIVYALVAAVVKLIFAIFGIYVDEDHCGHKTKKEASRGPKIIGLLFGILALFISLCMLGALFFTPGGLFFGINKGTSDTLAYEKTYDVDFETLKIEAEAGQVNIKNNEEDKAHVVIYSDEGKAYDIDKKDKTLLIDVENDGCRGFACFNYKIPRIDVYLPADYADKIEIENNYGDINVGYFENALVSIDEDMGKVTVDTVKELTMKNNMGATEINKVTGYVDISASMGSVEIKELALEKNSTIEASMGSINIKKAEKVYIDAKADMGSVNVSSNDRDSKVELKVRCSMGSVNIGN